MAKVYVDNLRGDIGAFLDWLDDYFDAHGARPKTGRDAVGSYIEASVTDATELMLRCG